jgi:purine-binding chemotaxis protein CheW
MTEPHDSRDRDGPVHNQQTLADALSQNRNAAGALVQQAEEAETEFLRLRLRDRQYAIPIGQVAEVIQPMGVTVVPHLPPYIRGVFNRHGKVTAVLDLAAFAGTEVEDKPKRLVVLEAGDLEAAVPVSDIVGIVSVRKSAIEPPLPHVARELGFVAGQLNLSDTVVTIIDATLLLENSRVRRGERTA